jgi:MFS family permease
MFRSVPYKWLVATAFVMALFMEILDMTVLNTALPILGEHFDAETSTLQWLVTGYLVSLAVFIPASGWVADRFGDKNTFVLALAIYTAASLWAGFANSVTELLIARVTQGVGGGLLTPVGTAMLFRAFPPHERARASAVLAIPTTPSAGPRPGARRLARRQHLVALGVPAQGADRHHRPGLQRHRPQEGRADGPRAPRRARVPHRRCRPGDPARRPRTRRP